MHEAIALMRATADECEVKSSALDRRDPIKSNLKDVAVKWHWLANEVARHCRLTTKLGDGRNAECLVCADRCLNRLESDDD